MFQERPADAYAGLRYLQTRHEIDPAKIGLIGWSQGGGVALLAISSKSPIWRDTPLQHGFNSAIGFYPARCNDAQQSKPFTQVEPNTWSPISPLLILQGGKDDLTRAPSCQRFADAAAKRGNPVKIKVYPDAVHAFDAPNLKLQRRERRNMGGSGNYWIGTDYAARKDALKLVVERLRRDLLD